MSGTEDLGSELAAALNKSAIFQGSSVSMTPFPSGRKDDLGKLRYDLVPPLAEQQMVAVLTFGAKKYAPENWRLVPDAKVRYHAALRRHVAAGAMGEKLDPESGLPHLAHALCCLAFLAELDAAENNPETP